MAKFAIYGMAGIGIAAAIGFVFALSFASNNELHTGPGPAQTTAPSPFSTMQPKIQPQPGNASPPGGEGTAAKMAASNESFANSQQATADLRPTLTSLVALNTNGEVINEITPEMEFKLGAPVLIQANFANGNEAEILQHTISMEVRSQNGNSNMTTPDSSSENYASFRGDIAKGANIALDLYWKPSKTGEFTILVFSTMPEDSVSTAITPPVAMVPIRVIE